MTIRHLEIFIEVANRQSFSQAAEQLYISQPSVSNAIRSLEAELAAPLFNRTTKRVKLTQAGQLFLARSKQLLSIYQQAQMDIAALVNPCDDASLRGVITIAASSLPAEHVLPQAIAKFSQLHPKVRFDVIQGDSEQALDQVNQLAVDIGMMGYHPQSQQLDIVCIYEDELIFVSKEPRNCADLSELFTSMPFIGREVGSGTRKVYESFLATHGITSDDITSQVNFNSSQAVLRAVCAGAGFAMTSRLAADIYMESQRLFTIATPMPLPKRCIYMIAKQTIAKTAAVRRFIDFMVQGSPRIVNNIVSR